MEALPKAIVTVLLFAGILNLAQCIKCYKCDYDAETCYENKITAEACKENEDCVVHTRTFLDNTTKYEYDCSMPGINSCLDMSFGKMCTEHCSTDLCHKVVMQTGEKQSTPPASPSNNNPVIKEVTTKTTTHTKANEDTAEGKKQNQNDGTGAIGSGQETTPTGAQPATNTTSVRNPASRNGLQNTTKDGKNSAGNVGFNTFVFLLNFLAALIA